MYRIASATVRTPRSPMLSIYGASFISSTKKAESSCVRRRNESLGVSRTSLMPSPNVELIRAKNDATPAQQEECQPKAPDPLIGWPFYCHSGCFRSEEHTSELQ